jgi:hypothetical protein
MGLSAEKAEREMPSTGAAKASFVLKPQCHGSCPIFGGPLLFQQRMFLVGNFGLLTIATSGPVCMSLIFNDYVPIAISFLSPVGDSGMPGQAISR